MKNRTPKSLRVVAKMEKNAPFQAQNDPFSKLNIEGFSPDSGESALKSDEIVTGSPAEGMVLSSQSTSGGVAAWVEPPSSFDTWIKSPEGRRASDPRLPTSLARAEAVLVNQLRLAWERGAASRG